MAENGEERFVDRRAASRMGADAGGSQEKEGAAGPDGGVKDEAMEAAAGEPVAENGQEGEPLEESTESVDELKEKADRFYANWQRSAADFINYKRRVEEERREVSRIANAALVINLLPVYDDLERAVNTVDAKLAGLNWVQGIEAIYRKFGHLLESMGVKEIPAEGERFDPELHEAVGEQPGDEGVVLHVAQKGYRLGDKVIRPSMVIVGNGQGQQ